MRRDLLMANELFGLNKGMDDFTIDEATKTVTITYNMNRILVKNRATAFAR